MPALRTYQIFISHAWQYDMQYIRLVELLDSAKNFSYRNYSAPKDKPLHTLAGADAKTKVQIKAAIDRKIAPAQCVLVISGMYAAYREWIQYEVDQAVAMKKPVICIKPWGSQVLPAYVKDRSAHIVGWNTESIVSAIRSFSL